MEPALEKAVLYRFRLHDLQQTFASLIQDGARDEPMDVLEKIWLPPRDSNPDMLIQSQLSYH